MAEKVQQWKEYNGEKMEGTEREGAGSQVLEPIFEEVEVELEERNVVNRQEEFAILKEFYGVGNERRRLKLREYQVDAQMGMGRFGMVWEAMEKGSGRKVALKQFSADEVPYQVVWKERDILVALKGPRIINIIGAFWENWDTFLVLELCYGDLNYVIHRLSDRQRIRCAVQLAQALEWIHSNDVIHADLRPEHCLVTTSNNFVLSGFGSAVILKRGYQAVKALKSLGMGGYQDYEANKEFIYSKKSDMFAFACILFEVQSGGYLLRYEHCEIGHEEYARAYKDGRVKDLRNAEITEDMEREPLMNRIEGGGGNLADLLKKLITERSTRMSATEFLESEGLQQLMNEQGLSLDQMGNDSDMDSPGFNKNRHIKFRPPMGKPSNLDLLRAGMIYYDEQSVLRERGEIQNTKIDLPPDVNDPVIDVESPQGGGAGDAEESVNLSASDSSNVSNDADEGESSRNTPTPTAGSSKVTGTRERPLRTKAGTINRYSPEPDTCTSPEKRKATNVKVGKETVAAAASSSMPLKVSVSELSLTEVAQHLPYPTNAGMTPTTSPQGTPGSMPTLQKISNAGKNRGGGGTGKAKRKLESPNRVGNPPKTGRMTVGASDMELMPELNPESVPKNITFKRLCPTPPPPPAPPRGNINIRRNDNSTQNRTSQGSTSPAFSKSGNTVTAQSSQYPGDHVGNAPNQTRFS